MPNGDAAQSTEFFYTYRVQNSADDDLEQGDLLAQTSDIKKVLQEIHPYYTRDSYTHFLVLTQTCDLVRRKGDEPKSRYITLAAVRPLDLLVGREIEKYQDTFEKAGKVCSKQYRGQLKQFLERLFNYNEPEYFYLHSESQAGFDEPHCAFLKLSVSIKASLHYKTCQQARVLSLKPLYQAKLGWMLGNMYSRVGTDEWVPTAEPKDEFEERIKTLLDRYYKWADPRKLQQAKLNVTPELLAAGTERIQKHIDDTVLSDPTEEVIAAVLNQLQTLGIGTTQTDAEKIGNRLKNDAVFAKLRKKLNS